MNPVKFASLPVSHLLVRNNCIVLSLGENPELGNNKGEVHSVASVLKSYFRELPEPLIPYDYFEVFLTAARCKL